MRHTDIRIVDVPVHRIDYPKKKNFWKWKYAWTKTRNDTNIWETKNQASKNIETLTPLKSNIFISYPSKVSFWNGPFFWDMVIFEGA